MDETQLLLHAVTEFIRQSQEQCPNISRRPAVNAAFQHLIAAALLQAAPHDIELHQRFRDDDDRPASLRNAVRFIHKRADSDLSIIDIAAAAYVTPRTLQLLFRKHHGCTPTAYLRHFRLKRARAELLLSHPSTTTVTDVARRWRFTHVGRFCRLYRNEFGESPRDTLVGNANHGV